MVEKLPQQRCARTPNVLSHNVLIALYSLVTYGQKLCSVTCKDGIFMNRRANSSYFHDAIFDGRGAIFVWL